MNDFMINIDEDAGDKFSDINEDVVYDIIECMKPLNDFAKKGV